MSNFVKVIALTLHCFQGRRASPELSCVIMTCQILAYIISIVPRMLRDHIVSIRVRDARMEVEKKGSEVGKSESRYPNPNHFASMSFTHTYCFLYFGGIDR